MEVTPEEVNWLWEGYIPLGKLTVLDGDPGLGKSTVSLDIVSRISNGLPMPDGSPSEPGGSVLLSIEDGLSDTICPRLKAAGADLKKIDALQGVATSDGSLRFPTISDIESIEKAVKKVNAKLVVVDPLMGFLNSSNNSYKDQDIRQALNPLCKMAENLRVAVIIIRHLNKGGHNQAIYRGGGSIGIIGAARMGLIITKDPDKEDGRILAITKSNLSKMSPSLAFHTEDCNGVAKIIWDGTSNHQADTLLNTTNEEEKTEIDEAKDFIKDSLSDGDKPANEMFKKGRNMGISERTLNRAKKALGVTSKKAKFNSEWKWGLPISDSKDAKEYEEGHTFKGGTLRNVGTLRGEKSLIDLTNINFEVIG